MSRFARGLSVVAVAGIVAVTFGTAAEAHDKAVTASCETGLSVTLTRYDASTVNTLKVTEDTVILVSVTFGTDYSHTFPNGDKTHPHSYHVVVTAGDGSSFGLDQTLTIPACQTPATEVPPSTTTTGPASTAPATTTPPSSTSTPVTNPATSLPPATSTSVAVTTSQPAPVTTAASATTSPPPGTVSSVTPSTTASSLPTSSPTAAPTTTTDGTLIHETIDRGAPPKALPATGAASRVLIIIGFVLLGFGLILVFGKAVARQMERQHKYYPRVKP